MNVPPNLLPGDAADDNSVRCGRYWERKSNCLLLLIYLKDHRPLMWEPNEIFHSTTLILERRKWSVKEADYN